MMTIAGAGAVPEVLDTEGTEAAVHPQGEIGMEEEDMTAGVKEITETLVVAEAVKGTTVAGMQGVVISDFRL